jgi:hypothetical protein
VDKISSETTARNSFTLAAGHFGFAKCMAVSMVDRRDDESDFVWLIFAP